MFLIRNLVGVVIVCKVFVNANKLANHASDVSNSFFVLKDIDDTHFAPPENSIFYIETAPRGLNLREACSVESAAKAHPKRDIFIFFTEYVNYEHLNTKPMIALSKYSNVKLYKLDIERFSKDTPLEDILSSKDLKGSAYIIHHKADVLRYLIMYKFAGFYSDLDLIMVKPLDALPQPENWTCREDDEALGAGIMSFSDDEIGRRVINDTVSILKNNFDPDTFAYNSIGVLEDALFKLCSVNTVKNMSSAVCKGFEVYRKETFYIIAPQLSEIYFHQSNILPKIELLSDVYGFHVWNYLSRKIPLHSHSLYSRLMKMYCPVVDSLNNNYNKTTVVKITKVDVLYKNIIINEKEVHKQHKGHEKRFKKGVKLIIEADARKEIKRKFEHPNIKPKINIQQIIENISQFQRTLRYRRRFESPRRPARFKLWKIIEKQANY